MDDLDELWRALDRIATTPRLLVACDFDGGLAPDLGDADDARAEQLSSEALNILLALRDTTVAVVSRRDPEQVAQLMRLSGSKGGLRHVAPQHVDGLRDEVDATGVIRISAVDERPQPI
jgi:trehalose-6-phosphatase